MLRSSDAIAMDRLRWVAGVGGAALLGGLGWLLAGPLLAAPIVAWRLWQTRARWDAGNVGVELRDEGLVCVKRRDVAAPIPWHRVAGFRLEQLPPRPGYEHLTVGRSAQDPILPVVDLTDGSRAELWPLAVSQYPTRPKNRSEPDRILLQLRNARAEREAADVALLALDQAGLGHVDAWFRYHALRIANTYLSELSGLPSGYPIAASDQSSDGELSFEVFQDRVAKLRARLSGSWWVGEGEQPAGPVVFFVQQHGDRVDVTWRATRAETVSEGSVSSANSPASTHLPAGLESYTRDPL